MQKSAVYTYSIVHMQYIVLCTSHAQMTTEEARPDARARRRAMIEVQRAASQLLAAWSPVTVNLCECACICVHTMYRQSPCSATHARANKYARYLSAMLYHFSACSCLIASSALPLVTVCVYRYLRLSGWNCSQKHTLYCKRRRKVRAIHLPCHSHAHATTAFDSAVVIPFCSVPDRPGPKPPTHQ